MLTYLIQAIGLGFAAAAQPGPLQTYLISRTLSSGWRRALPAVLAPLISDGPIITLVLLVLSRIPEWLERFLYLAGGVFVLYLAFGAFSAWRRFNDTDAAPEASAAQSLLGAVMVNLLNPNPYMFCALVAGPILLRAWRESTGNAVVFVAGFYGVFISVMAAMVITFGTAARLGPKVNRALLGVSAAALACFGLYQLWLGAIGGRLG